MTVNEKRLGSILLVTVAFAALSLSFRAQGESAERAEAAEKAYVTFMDKATPALSGWAAAMAEASQAEGGRHDAGGAARGAVEEGDRIRASLVEVGFSIRAYEITGAEGEESIEFSVVGSRVSLVAFLSSFGGRFPMLQIEKLAFREARDAFACTMRIAARD
jgi:hypothetical protein